jgi:hypothetical protein
VPDCELRVTPKEQPKPFKVRVSRSEARFRLPIDKGKTTVSVEKPKDRLEETVVVFRDSRMIRVVRIGRHLGSVDQKHREDDGYLPVCGRASTDNPFKHRDRICCIRSRKRNGVTDRAVT